MLVGLSAIFPACELELKKITLDELEAKDRIEYWPVFTFVHYMCHMLTLLAVTTVLKRLFARPRPSNPREHQVDGKPLPHERSWDMRTRETNCSFPSGDAAQASIYGVFFLQYFPNTFMVVGGPIGATQFVITVCFARVYYQCHYVGDTMFGVMVGVTVSLILVKLGMKDILVNLFFAFSGSGSDSENLYNDDEL